MLWVSITIFVITCGFTSADEDCSKSLFSACFPDDETPLPFPREAEELKILCDKAIRTFVCAVEYEERCNTLPDFLPQAYSVLPTLYEVCNPDTLLHDAVVDNLKCFDDIIIKDESHECYDEPLEETLEKQVEELAEEGFKALIEDDESEDPYVCLRVMNGVACEALRMEQHCGTIAKDAFVDIIRKIALPLFDDCEEKVVQMLPSVIRLRKLENEIEEALKKRRK